MYDLNQDLQDYQDMKRWVAGEKPPAQGRTWRRGVHARVAEILPTGVMRTIDRTLTYVPYTPFATLMRVTLSCLFGIGGAEIALMLVENALPEASQTLPPFTQALRPMIDIFRLVAITLCAVVSLITAGNWVTNGD